jgi:hypothetical protein
MKFPGYVKLSFAEVKTKYLNLTLPTKMKDDKLYLSNSIKMTPTYIPLFNSSGKSFPSDIQGLVRVCQEKEINGPHTDFD